MSSEASRTEITLTGSAWPFPWPEVFELAEAVPCKHWSLIGGLMVQLHCYASAIEPPRPTSDIDALAHIEIEGQGSLAALKTGLTGLGYQAVPPSGRKMPLHRYSRGGSSAAVHVDFLIADHAAPRVFRPLPRPTPVRAPAGAIPLPEGRKPTRSILGTRSGTSGTQPPLRPC